MDADTLMRTASRAPKTPGIYFWRDEKSRPIYIGKANDLRNRLASYRRAESVKIRAMIRVAASVDWEETPTDIEALILESRFIKRHRPRYNVEWRDDKQYFYVELTRERFPHITVTHRLQSIGPFTEGVPLKVALRLLRRLFPYCTCPQRHHLKCLNAHIGRCPGYCCLKSEPTVAQIRAYARNVRIIRDILTGKRSRLVTALDDEMLARVFRHAQVNARVHGLAARGSAPHRVEGYDIAHISGQHATGTMVVFTDGRRDPSAYRTFNVRATAGGDTAMLAEVLTRRLRHTEWPLPDFIVVDGGVAQLNAARRVVGKRTRVIAVTKNERHRAANMLGDGLPADRALAFAVDAEAHRFSIGRYRRRHRRLNAGGERASM